VSVPRALNLLGPVPPGIGPHDQLGRVVSILFVLLGLLMLAHLWRSLAGRHRIAEGGGRLSTYAAILLAGVAISFIASAVWELQ
jgi:hypothetical protein